jgi:glutaminyl-peptide cyclotransferase
MSLRRSPWIGVAAVAVLFVAACGHDASGSRELPDASSANNRLAPSAASVRQRTLAAADAAPPAAQTGGFDGAKAYDHVAKLVDFGPHPPASEGIHKAQNYIRSQLQGFGCAVQEDDFNAQTPIGNLPMKNILAKVPGMGQGIILLLTHYDTLREDNFVGAEDSGSSTGLMLEIARILCRAPKQPNAVWIAFLDGEEAQVVENGDAKWSGADSVYGSRELAARLAVSADLKRVRAVILADMIGQKNLEILRESGSTKWLTDLVWRTAARLGYQNIFAARQMAISDDHESFVRRGVPSVDIIDLEGFQSEGYWHTPRDTLDKISPRSLAIVGHVILASVNELQNKFR